MDDPIHPTPALERSRDIASLCRALRRDFIARARERRGLLWAMGTLMALEVVQLLLRAAPWIHRHLFVPPR